MRPATAAAAFLYFSATVAFALPTPILIGDNGGSFTPSAVPGVTGDTIDRFDRPRNSLSGNYWAVLTRSNNADAAREASWIRGSGSTAELIVQEGVTVIEGTRTTDSIADRWGGVNDSGEVGLHLDLAGATTDDRVAVRATPLGFNIAFREGQTVAGQSNLAYGTTIEVNGITNAGGLAARLDSVRVNGASQTNDAAAVLNNGSTVAMFQGSSVPTNAGGLALFSIDIGGVSVNAAGTSWLVSGVVGTSANQVDVTVVDGDAKVVEGQLLPGTSSTVVELYSAGAKMEPNGDWYTRVRLNTASTGPSAIVRNGQIIAQTGATVPGGLAGEVFADIASGVDTFFANASDGEGNYVYAGFTSNQQAVWIYNDTNGNSSVLLREGAPVDLNNNGIADDNAFIDVRNLVSASLGGEFEAYVLSPNAMTGVFNMVDSSGAYLGQALLNVPIPEPMSAVAVAGGLLLLRRRRGVGRR